MRHFVVTKYYRGGMTKYNVRMPDRFKMRRDCWQHQLHDWGENTDGGHNYGYRIAVHRVKKPLPKGTKYLYPLGELEFDPNYLEKRKGRRA